MGVPLVTLTGQMPHTRIARSVLANAGLEHLAAEDEGRYLQIAVELAAAPTALAELRGNLRSKMRRSRVMDHHAVTGDLEGAYRQAWRNHAIIH